MAIRNNATITTAKLVAKLVKFMGKGQATALPGLISEKMSPDLLSFFSSQIPLKILITGTNGKTTTQKALASIFESSGKRVLANRSGSNMRRGLLSNFISKCDPKGQLDYDVAVLEIEEASLPKVVVELDPQYIIFTNLYRDQLDAYGELDRTRGMFIKALSLVPKAVAIINADDPRLDGIIEGLSNKKVTFSLHPDYILDFKYEGDESKARSDFQAHKIKINDDLGTKFWVLDQEYVCSSPGVFNVYNALAAIVAAKLNNISVADIKKGLLLMKAPFGRGEVIKKNGINYRLLLAKNPAGLNLVFKLLLNTKDPNLILLLNDRIADGRDVSWIWDADFEILNKIKPDPIIVGGRRAEELLLRLKYTFDNIHKISEQHYVVNNKINIYFVPDISELVNFIEREKIGDYFYVIPTYTAMLEFRKRLLGHSLDE